MNDWQGCDTVQIQTYRNKTFIPVLTLYFAHGSFFFCTHLISMHKIKKWLTGWRNGVRLNYTATKQKITHTHYCWGNKVKSCKCAGAFSRFAPLYFKYCSRKLHPNRPWQINALQNHSHCKRFRLMVFFKICKGSKYHYPLSYTYCYMIGTRTSHMTK